MRQFAGAYPVLVTPFLGDGEIDWKSLDRLVDYQLECRVPGIVCFGLASEVYKLADAERTRILQVVVERAGGRVIVIAGSEHAGTEIAVRRAVALEAAGAAALMLFPPSFVKPEAAAVVEYYSEVAAATTLPVIIQDAPGWTGVPLPVSLLAAVAAAAPTARYVKVEAPPTAPKVSALEALGLECIGGYGTLYLLEELDRGISATMPGCGAPRAQLEVLRLHAEGRRREAATLFNRILPLNVFAMSSLDVFVGVHKHLLWKKGVIDSARLRRPAVDLDDRQRQWLEETARSAGIDDNGTWAAS